MYHFIKAEKDSTIYQLSPNDNTGLDPILEVSAGVDGSGSIRTLLDFDVNHLSNHLASITGSKSELLLTETQSQELKIDYTVVLHPVLEPWQMGASRRGYTKNSGVTWEYTEIESGSRWSDSGSTFDPLVSSSQDFSYESANIEMDVTNLVDEILSGSITNYGFVLKFEDKNEDDSVDYGTLKFFSKETHTIFQPKIRTGWDDHEFNPPLSGSVTGSMKPADQLDDGTDIRVISLLKNSYTVDTEQRIRVVVKEKYPKRSFDIDDSNIEPRYYLPSGSMYSVEDIVSKHKIIPFSDFSQLSVDDNGNYFDIDFENWETDRVYEVKIKTDRFGYDELFEDKFIFTLTK